MRTMDTAALPVSAAPHRPDPSPAAGGWDWWLLATSIALAGFGLLMILSASSVHADARYGDALRFVTRQSMGLGMGLAAAVAALVVPWRWYRSGNWYLYALMILMLLLVWTPLGEGANGARRWLNFGLMNVQPSELVKVGLILFASNYLAGNAGRMDDLLGTIAPLVTLCAVPIVLVFLEPDFGSTVILSALLAYLLLVAGLRKSWMALLGVAASAVLAVAMVAEPYRMRRLTSFSDPLGDAEGDGYQVVQAWIAMGSGGATGKGLGTGVAQSGFLPEAHTDFIGAVVAEELGAVGWVALVAAYGILLWRGTVIASNARTLYGNLVAGGVTTLLASQVVVNLGVIVGLLPPKGLVLPFLSYGATAAIANVLCVGILLRIGLEGGSRKDANVSG